ncbi:MAG: hypothetical protein KAJ44_00785 [Thermoplasmatales archaeon]|nr:hypothetical protein [Thermoplasmatales archaeon]
MVEIKTQKGLKRVPADLKQIIEKYPEWWQYLCEVCSKTEDMSVIRYRMFIGQGHNFRPQHWIEEDTFQELIRLAKMAK